MMKQKTLGERLFDPRWLSNRGDARRDFKEPPVGLDLARALAARQLDSCDLGEKDKAEVASALDEEVRRGLTEFLDGLRTEPPASLVVPQPSARPSSRSSGEGSASGLRSRCAEVLASLIGARRWAAAAGVLLAGGVVVATWFAVARSRAPGSEDRPAWASAMIAAAVPSDGLATWGGEEQRSLTRYLEPPGLTTNSSRYIDPRVVAVTLDDGTTFQSGTAIGPRLVLTLVATGLARPARVYQRDGEEWVERSGELRTELGIGLATLVVVDGAPFESWFDPAAWSETELSVQQVEANGAPIDRSVGCYGLGGSEGGVLLSSNGGDRAGDLIFTDCAMRPGLGGGALARLVEGDLELLGIVVGSNPDGAVAVSAAAVRQQLFSEADLRIPVSSSGEG